MWYHLRVSVADAPDATEVIENYLTVFPVEAYLFAYEEKEDNHHFHGHIKYESDYDPTAPKNKVKRSEFFKKMKKLELVPDKTESNYHEVCKDELKNLAYCIKDCHILSQYNISEQQLLEAEEYKDRIQTEIKTPMKEQLLNEWLKKDRCFVNRLEAFVFIDSYHIERDYLPPNMTNKIQYALYIIYKWHNIYKCILTEESFKLIGSLQNIHNNEAHESYVSINHIVSSYDEKSVSK